jgi:hypothetical protein
LSIKLSVGYGFSATNDVLGWSRVNDGQNNITEKQIRGTFGQGLVTTLVLSYRAHRNLSVELGGFANSGAEIRTEYLGSTAVTDQYQETFEKVNSNGLLVGMSVQDTLGSFELGLHNFFVCGIGNKGLERIVQVWPNDTYVQNWEYTKNLSFGWMGNISVAYLLSQRIAFGIEGFVMLHSWSPERGELVKYTHNNQDSLSTVPEEYRTIEYTDNMNYSSVGPFPSRIDFSFNFPLHVAGVNVAFRYRF